MFRVENRIPLHRALQILSLSTYTSPRNLGGFPEGHLFTAPASQPQDTPQFSSKDKAWWEDICVGKSSGIICLHACDFRFYVRCPCHFNSGAFPRCGSISLLGKSRSPSTLGFSPAHCVMLASPLSSVTLLFPIYSGEPFSNQ